jgi:hypothetical protein
MVVAPFMETPIWDEICIDYITYIMESIRLMHIYIYHIYIYIYMVYNPHDLTNPLSGRLHVAPLSSET